MTGDLLPFAVYTFNRVGREIYTSTVKIQEPFCLLLPARLTRIDFVLKFPRFVLSPS